MILDTTYLLPLARIDIDTDLLKASIEGKTNIKIEEIAINLISLFELQAKAVKLGIASDVVSEAFEAIFKAFRVVPFYEENVVKTSFNLRKTIPDYIDCVVLATAIVLNEDLVTEDSVVHAKKDLIEKEYKIKIYSFSDLIRSALRK
ncbi:MAG: PIN domain-containing protein [Thermoproteota archaeon]|jgi:predicted nucleic acid-binding protein